MSDESAVWQTIRPVDIPRIGDVVLIVWWSTQGEPAPGGMRDLSDFEKTWIRATVLNVEEPNPQSGRQYFEVETALRTGTLYRRRLALHDLGIQWREMPILDRLAQIG